MRGGSARPTPPSVEPSAGAVNSGSRGRFTSPSQGEARRLWVSCLSLQKDASKNKNSGPGPALQQPGPQTSGLSFSPPCCPRAHISLS